MSWPFSLRGTMVVPASSLDTFQVQKKEKITAAVVRELHNSKARNIRQSENRIEFHIGMFRVESIFGGTLYNITSGNVELVGSESSVTISYLLRYTEGLLMTVVGCPILIVGLLTSSGIPATLAIALPIIGGLCSLVVGETLPNLAFRRLLRKAVKDAAS